MDQALSPWETPRFRSFRTRTRATTRFRNINRISTPDALTLDSTKSEPSSQPHPIEKIIRFIVYIIASTGMVLMTYDVTLEYLSSPTVTTETDPYPTQNVDFPAIAICSVNRISLKAAYDLAEELMELDSTLLTANLTTIDLMNMLRLMGHLYMFKLEEEEVDRVNLLHTILERIYNGYDTDRIMKRLTPKCRDVLRRCAWEGKDQVCNDLFYLRRTDTGYCCAFNYIRQTDGFGSTGNEGFIMQETLHTKKVGSEYGLSVLVNPQIKDAGYELLPSHGIKIKVYLPFDYPDPSSGGMREILLSPRMEMFLDLSAVTFYTDPDVEQYDVDKRDCLFSTEQANLFHGHYSFSDCIMHCRILDMLKLCRCVPFFFPVKDNRGAKIKTCNLRDLPCLKKYKDKWLRVKPRFEQNMVPFSDEQFEGKSGYLTCDCLPACEDTSYRVSASSIPLALREILWGRTKHTITNHSIIHIFFGQSQTLRLRQEVLFYAYELLSSYGGICSFFLGISIITEMEIFFKIFAGIWALKNKCFGKSSRVAADNTTRHRKMQVNSIFKPEKIDLPQKNSVLYWNEISRSVARKKGDSTDVFRM